MLAINTVTQDHVIKYNDSNVAQLIASLVNKCNASELKALREIMHDRMWKLDEELKKKLIG